MHTYRPDSEWMSLLSSLGRNVTLTITPDFQEISKDRSYTTTGAAATPKIVPPSGLSLPEALASLYLSLHPPSLAVWPDNSYQSVHATLVRLAVALRLQFQKNLPLV